MKKFCIVGEEKPLEEFNSETPEVPPNGLVVKVIQLFLSINLTEVDINETSLK